MLVAVINKQGDGLKGQCTGMKWGSVSQIFLAYRLLGDLDITRISTWMMTE